MSIGGVNIFRFLLFKNLIFTLFSLYFNLYFFNFKIDFEVESVPGINFLNNIS